MTTGVRVGTQLAAALFAASLARAQAAPSPTLAFTVTDSALRGPTAFTVGVVTIQLANRGRQVHQIQLLAIATGHTADEARTYILANDAPPPWSQLTTGVGPVGGGQTIVVTLKVDQGTYLLLDLLPDARGVANYRAGIIAPLAGSGVVGRDLANIPAVAGLIIANRFRFGNLFRTGNTWTQSESRDRNTRVGPGLQTIRIESFVNGVHSVVLARGGPEVMRQYVAWKEGRRATPPAGLVGGVAGVPGATSVPSRMSFNRVFLQVRLTPGGYIIFCPDRNGFETGEFTQFSVQ
jgi:hypothetical protein